MNPLRRRWLAGLLGACAAAPACAGEIGRGRPLVFPRDHGAHPDTRTEWWYATGWAGSAQAPSHGVQVTFFRSRTGLAETLRSRFAARQLLFAHAAVTDLRRGLHLHDQRIVRWAADGQSKALGADRGDTRVWIGDWSLAREASYRTSIAAAGFALQLELAPTQLLLLQGDHGFSRKGPDERHASHYYSQPQLALRGMVTVRGQIQPAVGTAWLDHEWSDELLAEAAVGWDWAGINLFDGSALTAFRLRRADGSAVWAGGSWRGTAMPQRVFGPDEVRWDAGRRWRSPATGAQYPTQWQLHTPAGRHELRALLDAQELDSRASTGTVYWEGLSELLDADGRRVGLGYLEMTGYAGNLRLG